MFINCHELTMNDRELSLADHECLWNYELTMNIHELPWAYHECYILWPFTNNCGHATRNCERFVIVHERSWTFMNNNMFHLLHSIFVIQWQLGNCHPCLFRYIPNAPPPLLGSLLYDDSRYIPNYPSPPLLGGLLYDVSRYIPNYPPPHC